MTEEIQHLDPDGFLPLGEDIASGPSHPGYRDVADLMARAGNQEDQIFTLQAENASLQEANEAQERQNAEILERLLNLRLDVLVTEAFTPEGLKDHLEHSPELQAELGKMRWGVIRLDGRFVKYMNRFGVVVGDRFLQEGGSEIAAIADGLARSGSRRTEDVSVPDDQRAGVDRRQTPREQGHSLRHDIICRPGGDEFSLIIRNVSPIDLTKIAMRIQDQLSVTRALERYEDGEAPFIASVGATHASEKRPEVVTLLNDDDPWGAFKLVNSSADEREIEIKKSQYNEMWGMVVSAMTDRDDSALINKPDERVIAERFLRDYCPDFWASPWDYLRPRS
jgi:hypothetical protein